MEDKFKFQPPPLRGKRIYDQGKFEVRRPPPVIKSSRVIALVLIPLGMMFLGFWANSCDDDSYATTQSSSGGHSSGGRSFWRSSSASSYGSGSSSHSGTSRGGFGSTGHSSS